jgi:catechol-2,3-dioxygenase
MLDNEFTHSTSLSPTNHLSVEWSRRNFLHRGLSLGVASALTGVMTPPILAASKKAPTQKVATGISELRLQTHTIAALEMFYGQSLGLPTQRNGDELAIDAGTTRIVFTAVTEGKPFYHFAFNIPENKLESAIQWQKKRTELVRRNNKDVVHFAKWNADSLFFLDPAGNLLEYIARHDLKNAATGDFSAADILYASEIGLVVDDIPKTVAAAKAQLNLGIYRDNSQSFASIGNEHALLVVVKRNRKWFPARKRSAKVFPLTATIRGTQKRKLVMGDYDYKVSTK